VNLTSGKQFKR